MVGFNSVQRSSLLVGSGLDMGEAKDICNVLLVDDEEFSQRVLRQMFQVASKKSVVRLCTLHSNRHAPPPHHNHLLLPQHLEYKTTTASSGAEALKVLRSAPSSSPFNLVLLDVLMPGETGDVLLLDIRQTWPDLCVIMVSAYTQVPGVSDRSNQP